MKGAGLSCLVSAVLARMCTVELGVPFLLKPVEGEVICLKKMHPLVFFPLPFVAPLFT